MRACIEAADPPTIFDFHALHLHPPQSLSFSQLSAEKDEPLQDPAHGGGGLSPAP